MEKNKKMTYVIITAIILVIITVFAYFAINNTKGDEKINNTNIEDFEEEVPSPEFDGNDSPVEVETN